MSDLPDPCEGHYVFAQKTDRLFSEPISPQDIGSVMDDVTLTVKDFVLDEELVNNAFYLLLRHAQHLTARLDAAELRIAVLESEKEI